MENNPLITAREQVNDLGVDAQERNRQWWERLPMTYVAWEADQRQLQAPEDFQELDRRFLRDNPWLLANFDFARHAGRAVLEIGCGAGAASCLFARAGAKLTAIDITENAVRMTEANARSQGLQLTAERMDAEAMSFPEASFDYVFSWGVLHHSRDPVAAFREVSRVLKPGGEGLLMVYNGASLRYYLKGLYWLLAKGKLPQGDTLATVQRFFTDGYYHRHFTPAELVAVLRSVGLTSQRVSITHMAKQMIPFLPRTLDEQLKRRYGWLLVVEFLKSA